MFLLKKLSNFYKYKRKFHINLVLGNAFCSNKSSPDKLKILFFGTDNFSLPSLEKIYNESQKASNILSVEVVTSFKSPSNPVRNFAGQKKLPVFRWPISETSVAQNFDLGVVVSFGHLIPSKIISSFRYGMINVHASLLPRWRGAAPIIYALIHGDKVTGVSIMKIEPKHFDTGDILAQRKVLTTPDMLMPELHDQLAKEGADLLLESVRNIPQNLSTAWKQHDSQATYAPKVVSPIGQVNWDKMIAEEVYNLYRGLYSFKHPTTRWQNQVVKLIQLSFSTSSETKSNLKPGLVEFSKKSKSLRVYCRDGRYIEITKIGIEGKRIMSAVDFDNGYVKKVNKDQRYFN